MTVQQDATNVLSKPLNNSHPPRPFMAPSEEERLKAGAWFIGAVMGTLFLIVHLYIGEFLLFKSTSETFLRTFGRLFVWPLRFLANITPAITIPWIIFLTVRPSACHAGRPPAAPVPYRVLSRVILSIGIYLLTIFLLTFIEHFLPGSITEVIAIADEWVDTFWYWSMLALAATAVVCSVVWVLCKIGPWLLSLLMSLLIYIGRFLRWLGNALVVLLIRIGRFLKWLAVSFWGLVTDVFHDFRSFFRGRVGKFLLKFFFWFTLTAMLAAGLYILGEYLYNRYF